MDDFKQSRYVRRLALATAITCSATAVYAAESATKSPASFRSLIGQGWKQNAANDRAPIADATTPQLTHNSQQTSTTESQTPDTFDAAQSGDEHPAGTQAAASADPNTGRSAINSTATAATSEPGQTFAGIENRSTGLAKLIRSHGRMIAVPKMGEITRSAPSTELKKAPVAEQESISMATPASNPDPMAEDHLIAASDSVSLAEQMPKSVEAAELTPVGPPLPIVEPKSYEDLAQIFARQRSVPSQPPLPPPQPTVSMQPTLSSQPAVLPPAAAVADFVPDPVADFVPDPVADFGPDPVADMPQPFEPSVLADSGDNGFVSAETTAPETAKHSLVDDQPSQSVVQQGKSVPLQAMAENQLELPIRIEPVHAEINEQAVRLREDARQSFQNANQRLTRGATHSAKMYAMQTMRSIAAMHDAIHGGNRHTTHLQAALDAIRESKDFNGTFGTIDQSALQRMVAVHKTVVLKEHDLENLSAIEASEAYLAVARDNLVAASGGAREASNALVIIGKVERQLATMNNAHASAVAMTMQDAAVQIAPYSVFAHYELGVTLSEQGLVHQAADSLKQSVSLRPTRRSYQKLLQLSRQCGDIDTVRSCREALKSDHLQTDIPVQLISPERFATTHRPAPTSYASGGKKSQATKSTSAKTKRVDVEATRVSWRSIIPFGRR